MVLLVAGLAAAASACSAVVGSGNMITIDIPVADFSRVEVSNAFDVNVTIGEVPSLSLRIDENVEPHLDVGVSGDTLRIGLESGISFREVTLEADFTVPSLDWIEASGAVEMHLENQLTGDNLQIELSGASFLDGPVEVQSMTAAVSGASELVLTGRVGSLTVDASGASQLALLELAVDQMDVRLSGASNADVSVGGTLSANLSGASSLRYRGEPTITGVESLGASSISQIP